MRWENTETPTFSGAAGSGTAPAVAERLNLKDRSGNVIAYYDKAVDGTITLYLNGVQVAADTDIGSIVTSFGAASASTATYLDFFEDTDNGTNRARLIGPASTADVTVTLPAATGTIALTSDLSAYLPTASVLRSYLATTVTYNANAVLADTALSVTVAAGGIYDISLVVNSTSAARQLNMDFGGTATIANFVGEAWVFADGVVYSTGQLTSAGTDWASVMGAVAGGFNVQYRFNGSVEITDAGTFLLRGAQDVSNASNTTILRGSTLTLTKMN